MQAGATSVSSWHIPYLFQKERKELMCYDLVNGCLVSIYTKQMRECYTFFISWDFIQLKIKKSNGYRHTWWYRLILNSRLQIVDLITNKFRNESYIQLKKYYLDNCNEKMKKIKKKSKRDSLYYMHKCIISVLRLVVLCWW